MWIRNLFDLLVQGRSRTSVQRARRGTPARRPAPCRLTVEALEDRCVPASVGTSLSVGDVTIMEGLSGTQNAAVIVSLYAPSTKTITVNYSTAAFGSALAGSDYDAVSGKLTFAPGETTKSILIPVHGDRLAEYNEWFYVTLQGAKGATIADGWGTVTIVDSSPRLSIGGASSLLDADGIGTTMTFTVSLSAAYDQTVTVNFRTRDGILLEGQFDAAYAGQDYVATSGTLTFAPGETSKTITVEILGSFNSEYDEWFAVDLSGASANAVIGNDHQRGFSSGPGLIYGNLGTPP
jgi:hypothetical protein